MKEIERKFLIGNPELLWKSLGMAGAEGIPITQSYLCLDPERTVRVRDTITRDGPLATLTIKGLTHGATRDEFEYRIPLADSAAMREMAVAQLQKERFTLGPWEIDVYDGQLHGLIVAEIELESEDQEFEKPPWLGREVTDDPRYYNSNLATKDPQ